MTALFWGSIIGVVYAYFGYPFILYLLSLLNSREVLCDEGFCPMVTLIVTVHNEERRLERKIRNTLEIDYPTGLLEIIFSSDASTDATDEIISRYSHEGIRLVRSTSRGGKELAQKCAIKQSGGNILVFSDVATMLDKNAIRTIVANFADESVGCVSSEDRVVDEHGNVSGEGAYVRYEMWLRAMETKVNSVVGLSGSFFAARKAICNAWPTDIPSDFNTLLNSIRAGLRGISDPKSIGIYNTVKDDRRELERKVRTITRGISALMANKGLLNPVSHGVFSWQLISHKLMRWLVPWFMMAALAANLVLSLRGSLYRALLLGQCMFYILSIIGSRTGRGSFLFKFPHFFVQANISILISWIQYLKGERYVTWTPSGR